MSLSPRALGRLASDERVSLVVATRDASARGPERTSSSADSGGSPRNLSTLPPPPDSLGCVLQEDPSGRKLVADRVGGREVAPLPSVLAGGDPRLDLRLEGEVRSCGEDAEDLVQDTVLKAFRAWDSFRQGTNARGWLLTILRNSFINDYRRRRRAPALVDLDVAEQHARLDDQPGQDPEGEFFHSLVDDRILAAIDGLPEEFREVVVLSDVEGLGYAQIAETLGVSRMPIRDALQQLSSEGLVEIRPNRGAVVARLREIYLEEMRKAAI